MVPTFIRSAARAAGVAAIAIALHTGGLEGQVAPTLPSDTLGGRKLPPEANVPRRVVAPTLPSDTLRAGGVRCPEPLGARIVPSTPRAPEARRDTVSADTAATDPCPARPDSVPAERAGGASLTTPTRGSR